MLRESEIGTVSREAQHRRMGGCCWFWAWSCWLALDSDLVLLCSVVVAQFVIEFLEFLISFKQVETRQKKSILLQLN